MRGLFFLVPLALVLAAACSPVDRMLGGNGGSGAGGGGTSSSSSSSAATGPCSPKPEDCYNGEDDDCDGKTDCADEDCQPTSVCVPQSNGAELGVLVAENQPCPPGFGGGQVTIHRGLAGDPCDGCGCTANPTQCSIDVWFYTTAAACTGDVNQAGGTYAGKVDFTCGNPIDNGAGFQGARTGKFTVTQTCQASGAAQPGAVSWSETMTFCRADTVGGGCLAGHACVPKEAAPSQCALVDGTTTCQGYPTQESDWFTDYHDTRACGACECTAGGGNCDNVYVNVGSDYSCGVSKGSLIQKDRQCLSVYEPPLYLSGTPVKSFCNADAPVTGSLDPAGQKTLCCLQ